MTNRLQINIESVKKRMRIEWVKKGAILEKCIPTCLRRMEPTKTTRDGFEQARKRN